MAPEPTGTCPGARKAKTGADSRGLFLISNYFTPLSIRQDATAFKERLESTMLFKKRYFYGCLIAVFLVWIYPMNSLAEFYKYVDKEGQTFYVDDLSKVPPEYMDQVNVYKEKYDVRWSWNCNRPLKKKKPKGSDKRNLYGRNPPKLR
jgi:hypothetical protein